MLDLKPDYKRLLGYLQPILVVAILSYFLLLLTYNLTDYTGLHVDEAWMGLNAIQINAAGLRSLHGMNHYTGSLYSFLIAGVFKFYGVSILSLRLPGAIANFLGIVLLIFNARQFGKIKGAWIAIFLILSFPGLFVFARVAWEVCAFHLLFIALKVTLVSRLTYRGRLSIFETGLFFTTSLLGVFNHFIFISDAVAFLLAAIANTVLNSERLNHTLAKINLLAVLNISGNLYYFIVKPKIEDNFFVNHFILSLLLLILPILVLSILFIVFSQDKYRQFLHQAIDRSLSLMKKLYANILIKFFAILLSVILGIIFVVIGFWVFLGTLSSLLPLQRILVYQFHWFPYAIMTLAWLLIMIGFGLTFCRQISIKSSLSELEINKLLFYLYPLFAVLVLPFFIRRTSTRHFLIAGCLLIGFLPLLPIDTLISKISNRLTLIGISTLLILNIIFGQSVLYQALFFKIEQQPFVVHYIGYRDKSKHFLQQDDLFQYLKANHICNFGDSDKYISDPLKFIYHTNQYTCDAQKNIKIEYCPTCTEPVKYHKISVKDPP